MQKARALAIAGGVLAIGLAGGGVAVATSDDSATVTGHEVDAATAAALEATGGGTANSVERDSENGATWEVEVTRSAGDTVDVRLDENYQVVLIEGDTETG
jgi:hypothetical protein